MTQRRVYLLIAALGLGVMTAVGVLNTPARDGGELREFDWGDDFQVDRSSAVINAIRVTAPFDAGEHRFSYYTGGHAPGIGEPSAAPERVIAEAVHGAATVRLRAFEPYTRQRATEEAAEIARIVSLATTRVWPPSPIAVQVDVHFIPDDAPFSLAKRVDWEEGGPYLIAVFARDAGFGSGTAAHELYHVLAGRWSLGRHAPANRASPNAGLAYEETSADLFASCGRLLATGSLSLDPPKVSGVIAGQRFEGALDSQELAGALDLLSRDVPNVQMLRALFAHTVLADAFGEQQTIVLESPQGERLLARCRESAANPMLLGFRLAEILKTAAAEPEPRALEN